MYLKFFHNKTNKKNRKKCTGFDAVDVGKEKGEGVRSCSGTKEVVLYVSQTSYKGANIR